MICLRRASPLSSSLQRNGWLAARSRHRDMAPGSIEAMTLDTYLCKKEQRHEEDYQRARQQAGSLGGRRSEEHTSELQSLMRNTYAVFGWKKKKNKNTPM